ncbi:MAG: F0F1 ATP synthase subunit B [Mycobacteriales bacterium]
MLNALVVAAAEGEDPFSPVKPHWNELAWSAVFFFVLLAILYRVAWPKLQAALAARQAAIAGNIEEAESIKAQADGVLAEYRAKLADAQTEAQRIIEEGRRTGEQVVADARQRADTEAQQLVTRAQADIAAERDRAITALRSELASLSIELASRVVGKSLDTPAQRALIDSYIDELATSAR